MAPPLTAARAQAETSFDSTCTITRPGDGEGTRDETTGTATPPAATVIYSGPCLLRPPSATTAGQPSMQGGAPEQVEDMRARIPASVTGVLPGDVLTVDTAPNDGALVARTYQVVRVIAGTYAVTRMLVMADTARGPRV